MFRNKPLKDKIKYLCLFIVMFIALWSGYEKGLEDKADMQNEQGDLEGSDLEDAASGDNNSETVIAEDGTYTSKKEVAEYIYTYGKLPSNFITKDEAQDLGWVNSEGNLAEVAPGMSIGGDYFGNYEGKLPEEDGREYHECDINYESGYRGSERIIYSNDGLIYYTADHYESFELLYGEE